ncbi:MAG: hypothetical protein QF662_07885, partial [Phycisphaerae bacterium]|nr:hypothetical protein [Phycisphaerae bacterium]
PSEDPYVVVKDGTFYLFYEDKHPDRHTFISVATSTDGIEWKVARKGAVRPTGTGWQEVIVASPIVALGPAGWIMLYEGCSSTLFTVNGGTIGYAVSENLLDWEQIPEPVFEGSGYLRYDWLIDYHWAHHIVPDDIIKDGEEYVMTYHGWSKWWGWQSGFATSSDLLSWRIPYDYPMSPLSTIMMARMEGEVRFYATTEKGVEFLRPLRGLTPEEARAAGLE